MPRLRLLLLSTSFAAALFGCKTGSDSNGQTKDISDTDTIENNFNGTFRVRCADGKFQNGRSVAVVTREQLRTVCEETVRGPGGPGGGPGNGPNGGSTSVDGPGSSTALESCPNLPPILKQLNIAVGPRIFEPNTSPQVAQIKLCNGFATPFGQLVTSSPELFNFLNGANTNNAKILINVGPANTRVNFQSFGIFDLPWDLKPVQDQLLASIKAQGISLFTSFSGIQTNVNIAQLSGWQVCYQKGYDDFSSIATMLSSCNKSKIMIGCGTQQGIMQIAAQGDRAEVFKDVGDTATAVNTHNGVDFYFSTTSRSMGFAKTGSGVNRNSCDTNSSEPESRLCWHVANGNFGSGWRCGSATGVSSASTTRYILQTDP